MIAKEKMPTLVMFYAPCMYTINHGDFSFYLEIAPLSKYLHDYTKVHNYSFI